MRNTFFPRHAAHFGKPYILISIFITGAFMAFVDFIGLMAGFCTTISFLPQIVRILRTKSAEDVSLLMIFIYLAGIALWLFYGILTAKMPIIVSNGVTCILASILLICKFRYRVSTVEPAHSIDNL